MINYQHIIYLFICVRKFKTFDLIHVLEYHGIYLHLELLTPLGVRNLTQQKVYLYHTLGIVFLIQLYQQRTNYLTEEGVFSIK